jgi:hypothetical protein
MASIETRIDTFITEHEIDPLMKDDICVLVTGCMEDLFKHVFSTAVPETEKKAKKVTKAEKIDDPTTCTSRDEIYKCTVGILNQYCKDHTLKVGGNKSDLTDRVWRHMQGESSDEDVSSRNKPKKEKKVPEKHACEGSNASGGPCNISATELCDGHHFCHRHIANAHKFIAAIEQEEEPEKPVEKKKNKVAKAVKEIEEASKPKPSSRPKLQKKLEPEPEPELETEEEEEETDD